VNLILRISVLWIVLGLVAGVVLRRFVPPRYLALCTLVAALPAAAHVAYVGWLVLDAPAERGGAATLFALVAVTLLLVVYGLFLVLARKRALWLSLYPLAAALAYLLVLLVFHPFTVRDSGAVIDNFSYVRLVWGTLFTTSALFVFALKFPRFKRPSLTLPRFGRRP
jgi:hypothetical protein